MTLAAPILQEDYWETFEIRTDDLEFLYAHLLESEIPQTTRELLSHLVLDRLHRELAAIDRRRSSEGETYHPGSRYDLGQDLTFPALNWRHGTVSGKRPGNNPDYPPFEVLQIDFNPDETREFASGISDHALNSPTTLEVDALSGSPAEILELHEKNLITGLEAALRSSNEFQSIAGRWFPRALLADIHAGQLNLAEAILDMNGGGPLSTGELLRTVELPENVNPTLAEFSLDYALWKDQRFDEVGPAGEILWHLKRLEPAEVLEPPETLVYQAIDYDPTRLTEEMRSLELKLDDELTPTADPARSVVEVEIRLIFPHWRSGTLPLASRLLPLFPTAYQAPRIRFMLVDGETGEKFPGWVVREQGYVFGLTDFYARKELFPGSLLKVRRSDHPGEVVIDAGGSRSAREWVRTVLVGSDDNFVLAMLKQKVTLPFDERMAIFIPDIQLIERVREKYRKDGTPFERIVVNTLKQLSKLSAQGHVHVSELYACLNVFRRCPPGPILALLGSNPIFRHVGDLHFKMDEM